MNINKIHTLFLVWLFAAVAFISVIVPPMQSPDESEHIVRAYLLGRGGIVLDAPAGNSSGGLIDLNLDKYIRAYSVFPFHPERKLSLSVTQEAESLRWSEEKSFRPALGMAYYFPVIYAPHAFGLGIGELLGLSIDHSYRLTRAILLGLTCLILFWSFRLHAPNYLVLLFLVMPMSIFQFASASLDGIATAFAILIISLFLKNITSEVKKSIVGGVFSIALLIWILLASSRLQLLPLILLLTGIGYLSRRWSYIFWCVVACALVLAWQVVALRTVIDALLWTVDRLESLDEKNLSNNQVQLKSRLPFDLELNKFVLITGHRRENFGQGMLSICEGINKLAATFPTIRANTSFT